MYETTLIRVEIQEFPLADLQFVAESQAYMRNYFTPMPPSDLSISGTFDDFEFLDYMIYEGADFPTEEMRHCSIVWGEVLRAAMDFKWGYWVDGETRVPCIFDDDPFRYVIDPWIALWSERLHGQQYYFSQAACKVLLDYCLRLGPRAPHYKATASLQELDPGLAEQIAKLF